MRERSYVCIALGLWLYTGALSQVHAGRRPQGGTVPGSLDSVRRLDRSVRRELLIRSGFVFNFARFTKWPARDDTVKVQPRRGAVEAALVEKGRGDVSTRKHTGAGSPGAGVDTGAAASNPLSVNGRSGCVNTSASAGATSPSTGDTGDCQCFEIAFLTDDPLRYSLVRSSLGKLKVQGLPVKVKMVGRPEDAVSCRVLFVDHAFRALNRLPSYKEDERWRYVLTVGDGSSFIDKGGDIYLYRRRNKLSFGINLSQCRAKGLKISSRVLSLGRIVRR